MAAGLSGPADSAARPGHRPEVPMSRSCRARPLLLLCAFAFAAPAAGASTRPIRLRIKAIVHDPQRYVGDTLETQGYVIDRFGKTAQMGGTNQGITATDTLVVHGAGAQKLNYFDRFRLEGVLEKSAQAHANGSHYELKLTAPPVPIGH
jgi:hypothetical protein